MKSIILFRHCKPESGGFGQDHDRPLALAGISDAKKMGIYLSRKNELPDLVISSTAVRAKMTTEIAMAEGKWSCILELNATIYGGDPLFILNLINNQNNSISSICIVGHEPNFSNFIARSTSVVYMHFPKGSMAKIDFDVEQWEEIDMGLGSLVWLVQPEEIGEG